MAKKKHPKYDLDVTGAVVEERVEPEPQAEPEPTSTYRVLRPTDHDGDLYLTGDAIDLTAKEAAPLLVKHHVDQPERVTIIRREPTKLPATPAMPTRVVEGTASTPAPAGVPGPAAVAPEGTITTNVTATA